MKTNNNNNNQHQNHHHYNIDNLKSFKCDFIYPEEEFQASDDDAQLINNFIQKFALELLAHKNPKVFLCCILYSVNYDVGIILNVENTETDIAKSLGISKQLFCHQLKSICKQYNIVRVNTGKIDKLAYKNTNFKKISYEKKH